MYSSLLTANGPAVSIDSFEKLVLIRAFDSCTVLDFSISSLDFIAQFRDSGTLVTGTW